MARARFTRPGGCGGGGRRARGKISCFRALDLRSCLALEATQGQLDGSFSQLPYKCHLEEVASVGD